MDAITVKISDELLNDAELFQRFVVGEIEREFWRLMKIDFMIWEYELINGEGSWEQFIFGGAPGL